MLSVQWHPPYAGHVPSPQMEFTLAIRACYSYAYRLTVGKPRDLELGLSASQLTTWTVAHRRMLLRVLLGLGATGVDTPTNSRGIAPWGLSSEAGGALPSGRAGQRPGGLPGRGSGPGLGYLRPGAALLVGDRPGPGWSGRLNWPFVSGHRGGCSAWLCDQLEAGSVPESRLYWINATTQDGAPTEPHFLTDLQPSITVALGRNATRWINEYVDGQWDVNVHEVHHPQHWKRFHSGDRYHLVKLLRKGLGIHVR